MSWRRRPCLPLPLRVAVLVLLALGVIFQPVLASLGELHELAHDPTGTHAVANADHSDHASDVSAASDPSALEPMGTLHLLMHHAHCCSHAPLALPQMARITPIAPGGSGPPLADSQRLPKAPSLAPFRPPILA